VSGYSLCLPKKTLAEGFQGHMNGDSHDEIGLLYTIVYNEVF